MILKKQEKDNVIKAIYSSANILASSYDKEKNNLTLIFNKGGQYFYPGVSNTDYTRFEIAESQGSVFNTHIKKYKAEKMENVNPETIIEEINTLKDSEKKEILDAKQLKLVNIMKTLISESTTSYQENKLELLKSAISEYITQLNTK